MQTILIVDDSRAIRAAIRRIVEGLGLVAEEAENGSVALERCRTGPLPDCILLDLVMPGMDGMTCLRELRQDPQLKDCVVVVCSTQNSMESLAEAVAGGADEFIMKPFTPEILREKLQQVGVFA